MRIYFIEHLLASTVSNAQLNRFNSFDDIKITYSDEGEGFSVLLTHIGI